MSDDIYSAEVFSVLPLAEIEAAIETNKQNIDNLTNLNKKLFMEIERRYSDDIASAYAEKGSVFGTVNIERDGIGIVFDRQKKVSYDQQLLEKKHNEIKAAGQDPAQYIDVEYSIRESFYKAWPDVIKSEFEPCRTVEPGRLSIKFKK